MSTLTTATNPPSSPFFLNNTSLTNFKAAARKSDYSRVKNFLETIPHLSSFIKAEPFLCYRIANFIVKALEEEKLSEKLVMNTMHIFLNKHDIFTSIPSEKETCIITSSDGQSLNFNKTLLRCFCSSIRADIQKGETNLQLPFSLNAIRAFKHYLYRQEYPGKKPLVDLVELYSLSLNIGFEKLQKICAESIKDIVENKVDDQTKLEETLSEIAPLAEKTVIEKIILLAFLKKQKIDFRSCDGTLSLNTSYMHLIFKETPLGMLLSRHVNGFLINSKDLEVSLLAFKMSKAQKENITSITVMHPGSNASPLLSEYFLSQFPNLEKVELLLGSTGMRSGMTFIEIEFLLEICEKLQQLEKFKKIHFCVDTISIKTLEQKKKLFNAPLQFVGNTTISMDNRHVYDGGDLELLRKKHPYADISRDIGRCKEMEYRIITTYPYSH